MTVHNRKDATLRCLESVERAARAVDQYAALDVYMVDDGCTDGTAQAVRARFPQTVIVPGDGTLYWCRGMRTAWAAASEGRQYDGYVWLNDDVVLADHALESLLAVETQMVSQTGKSPIVVGATQDARTGRTTYGEMTPEGVSQASKTPRRIQSFNGNVVLVPATVFQVVGNLSWAYRHGFGDLDYACRARRRGVPILLAPGHLGTCTDDKVSRWERADIPLKERLAALHGPTGCPPWELAILSIRHGAWWFPYTVARLYWRAFFPRSSHG
jgi:GT2 family glycosyltransferase